LTTTVVGGETVTGVVIDTGDETLVGKEDVEGNETLPKFTLVLKVKSYDGFKIPPKILSTFIV
jgi:hypothetical protein